MSAKSEGGEALARLQARLQPVLERLLDWYGPSHRKLPWRETTDPYRIWISEIMLQQTQVATVIPYYHRFIARFPTVETLAAASGEQVLKLWEGLGYYRRARYLVKTARMVTQLGGWPRRAAELVHLPGIGKSTAGAIASFAFGDRAPILDGNVRRVWYRLGALDPDPGGHSDRLLWRVSEDAVSQHDPALVNQALMELGATICSHRSPACDACPLSHECEAFRAGTPERFPPPKTKTQKKVTFDVSVGLILDGDRFLVTRRPDDGLLGGLWELPGGKWEPGEDGAAALYRELEEELGIRVSMEAAFPQVRHSYTHFSVRLHPFLCRLSGKARPRTQLPIRWITRSQIPTLAFPKGTLKVFERVWPALPMAADAPARWDEDGA